MTTTIPTPTTAIVAGTLDKTDVEKGRVGLGIIDNPIIPDRTYIIFDASAGNNDLHLDTGGSATYTILKGDGTLETSFTDTGGIKVLNYIASGRYTITIEGNFAGIDTSLTTTQSDLNKYVKIIAGSNYPTTIVEDAFLNCLKLTNAAFSEITTIEDTAFSGCSLLLNGVFPKATSVGTDVFLNCDLITVLIGNTLSFNGNVGIGTNAPTENLQIKTTTTDAKINVRSDGLANTASILLGRGARNWDIKTNTSAQAYRFSISYIGTDAPLADIFNILKTGEIGIGTNAPTENLQIKTTTTDAKININAEGLANTASIILGRGSRNWDIKTNTSFQLYRFSISYLGSDAPLADIFNILNNGNVGIGTNAPTEKLDVNGNIALSGIIVGDLEVENDIICDDVDCINIDASGNIGGATISEGGVLLDTKYVKPTDTVDFPTISEGGVLLDTKYVKPTDTVDFPTISEGGVLLASKYYKEDTLPNYNETDNRYEFPRVNYDRKPVLASAYNMGTTTQVVNLSARENYTDVILLTSSADVSLVGVSFDGGNAFGEKLYIFNEGNYNITIIDGGSTTHYFELDSSFVLKPKKWVMIMYPPKNLTPNKWTLFPNA